MSKISLHILRFGMAITFLWIGVLILRDPEAWSSYIQPWAANLLLVPPKTAMLATAVLDIAVGILFLTNYLLWLPASLASFHLAVVLTVSGINAITVRDIGLLAAAIALFAVYFPFKKVAWLLSIINNKNNKK